MEFIGLIIMLISVICFSGTSDIDEGYRMLVTVISTPILVIATVDVVRQLWRDYKGPFELTGKNLLKKEVYAENAWLRSEWVPTKVMSKWIKEANPIRFIKKIEIPSILKDLRIFSNYWMISFSVLIICLSFMLRGDKNHETLLNMGIIGSSIALVLLTVQCLYCVYKYIASRKELEDLMKKTNKKKPTK